MDSRRIRRRIVLSCCHASACGRVWRGSCLCAFPARPQVIEFESNGLKYQTLSKSGVTLMFAPLAYRLKSYADHPGGG